MRDDRDKKQFIEKCNKYRNMIFATSASTGRKVATEALIQAENNCVQTDILHIMAENDKAGNEVLLCLVDTLDLIFKKKES